MGIEDLWKLLEPVAERTSLHHLAVEHGFVDNIGGIRAYRVGIDASGWIYRALYRHSATKNPELATLYARCCRLLDKPMRPYFIFDGPKRPSVKRGKHVRGNPHWLEQAFKKMLEAFGFPWIVALGEADAELAWLSKEQIIDAVASEDSDLIVLGAAVVLRNFLHEDNDEKVTVYRADAIADHAALGFTSADFLLIALLVGGDYDDGLERCGIQTATGLARAGLGHRLLQGLESQPQKDIEKFLGVWRNDLRDELQMNNSGHLPSRQPALSKSISSDFPQLKIVELYRNPLSSKANPTDLVGNGLDPVLLATFAEENFCWGSTDGILSHFETTIFPALALDDVCRITQETDLGLARRPCTFIGEVLKHRAPLKARDCPRHPEVRLSLIVQDALVDSIIDSLSGKLNDSGTEQKVNDWRLNMLPKMRVWLPVAMIRVTFPDLIVPAGRKSVARTARMSTGRKAPYKPPRASGPVGMSPVKRKRPHEDEDGASSSRQPGHLKMLSADHFDTIDLCSPEPMFEESSMHKQQKRREIIETIDLTQSDPEPAASPPRYRIDISDDGHIMEFITDSEGEL